MMVTLQPRPATEDSAHAFLDDEDERERVVLVDVAGKIHAVPVTAVREVLRARTATRVPGAPPTVLGLVNVRGTIVTVLDLARCLREGASTRGETMDAAAVTPGADTSRAESVGSIVLLEHGARLVGVAVRGVRDVRPVDSLPTGVGAPGAHDAEVTMLDVAALLGRHLISTVES